MQTTAEAKEHSDRIIAERQARRLFAEGTPVKVKAELKRLPHPKVTNPGTRNQRVTCEPEIVGTYRGPSLWTRRMIDPVTMIESEVWYHIIDISPIKSIDVLSDDIVPVEAAPVAASETKSDPTTTETAPLFSLRPAPPKAESRSIVPGYQPRRRVDEPPAILPTWATKLIAEKDAEIARLNAEIAELKKARAVDTVATLPPPLYCPNMSSDAALWLCDFLEIAL